MYAEDDLLPIAALQQFAYCERRCALMHIEGMWADNRFTVEGRHLHERVHQANTEVRGDLRIAHGLRLRSLRLGLTGMADVVEFHRLPHDRDKSHQNGNLPSGVALDDAPGLWQPFPVEYKRGRPKLDHCDEVQLCAQALCLEEMLNAPTPIGALFYGKQQRRHEVAFGKELRRETEALCVRLHELILSRTTPPPQYEKKCRNCSLLSLCLPQAVTTRRSANKYLDEAITEVTTEHEGE